MNEQQTIPQTDLVIVIDTSVSMKDEALALSEAAQAAIETARSSCPSDLRVAWLGIEGTWKGTHFNRTVRDYLVRECKAAESDLRGRTRGTVAGGGAQEDAARVIEDISTHFDWRPGVTRALFYLGDEALEGGGDKTEQKDIEAADRAIHRAQEAEVTVHTYFGTSKSKFKETIQKEYARVAHETGGQTFTDQDAISGFVTVLEKVICSSYSPRRSAAQLLIIDPIDNCYVIDPARMNELQERVASSITLEQGTYTLQITEGQYQREPMVVLWMYAAEGSTFVNKASGVETGTTWTTLNGDRDALTLEVKDKTTICGLFFSVGQAAGSGSVNLSITSAHSSASPQSLTIDSQRNGYWLDENYLASLQQRGANCIDLEPGSYTIQMRPDSWVSYWSEHEKFDLEPWALIWIRGGKLINRQTDVEVGETWCSVNSFNEEIALDVKERTTLCGLFFDTYKEDNRGKIYLTIEEATEY